MLIAKFIFICFILYSLIKICLINFSIVARSERHVSACLWGIDMFAKANGGYKSVSHIIVA